MDLAYRQIQIIDEEHLKHCFSKDQGNHGTDYTLMTSIASRGVLCICPALSEWIADEFRKTTAIDKERRKAVELRTSYPNAKQQRDRKARGGGGKGGPEV